MENINIKRIQLEGVHQRYNLDVSFFPTLNVLHGQNGTGKTTLIHILANIANCDFLRFVFLDFSSVRVDYSSGEFVHIRESTIESKKWFCVDTSSDVSFHFSRDDAFEALGTSPEDGRRREPHPLFFKQKMFLEDSGLVRIKTSYFPAFRTMLEAWSAQGEEEIRRSYVRNMVVNKITNFSRNIFGKFLPVINYPSPLDIESNLREEIRDAQLKIARYESSVFSESFVKVFKALLSGTSGSAQEAEDLLEEITEITKQDAISKLVSIEGPSYTYAQLQQLIGSSRESREMASSATGALTVYRDALRERREFQKEIFAKLDKYFEAVNAFLDKRKQLSYEPNSEKRIPKVGLKFPDGTWSSVRTMSSGERQLLTMLYAVTKMSSDSLVLIDEPELSLHIDWQEDLLHKMMSQLGNRQIIVCTHSPSIAADYLDHMIEVSPVYSSNISGKAEVLEDDEEVI